MLTTTSRIRKEIGFPSKINNQRTNEVEDTTRGIRNFINVNNVTILKLI